jgi:hypothetical protein
MQGYDVSFAAFNIVEVMSSTKFAAKRVGYTAASQSFHEKTDVIMLATNLLKKVSGVVRWVVLAASGCKRSLRAIRLKMVRLRIRV